METHFCKLLGPTVTPTHSVRVSLDFNRQSELRSDGKNHSSALDHPDDILAYLNEEKEYNSIIGLFKSSPIPDIHISPFVS